MKAVKVALMIRRVYNDFMKASRSQMIQLDDNGANMNEKGLGWGDVKLIRPNSDCGAVKQPPLSYKDCSWPRWWAAVKWSEERVTGSLMKHRAETLHSLLIQKALLTLLVITVRQISLWKCCFGGWTVWQEHRFGYMDMHFSFFLLFLLKKCTPL